MNRIVSHLRGNAVAYLALFIALGGSSYAAFVLPANSVGTKQIRNHAITPIKLDPKTIGASVRAWAVIQNGTKVVASRPRARVGRGTRPRPVVSWGRRNRPAGQPVAIRPVHCLPIASGGSGLRSSGNSNAGLARALFALECSNYSGATHVDRSLRVVVVPPRHGRRACWLPPSSTERIRLLVAASALLPPATGTKPSSYGVWPSGRSAAIALTGIGVQHSQGTARRHGHLDQAIHERGPPLRSPRTSTRLRDDDYRRVHPAHVLLRH